jgi:hypothetical protein
MRRKNPVYGDIRIRRGFLFMPKSVNHQSYHTKETRWLEFAVWEEEFTRARWGEGWWMMNRFLDKGDDDYPV